MNWDNAQSLSVSIGGYLWEIEDQAENDNVRNQIVPGNVDIFLNQFGKEMV